MATITFTTWAGLGWNMFAVRWPQPDNAIGFTETTSTFKLIYGGGYADTFTGSGFRYSPAPDYIPYAGTISTWSSIYAGKTVFSATGLNVPVTTFMVDLADNDWAGLMTYALSGNDTINGSAAADVLSSSNGNDTVNGGGGDDYLYSGEGADILNGGAGADDMTGGDGNDIYDVDNAGDQVTENAGGGNDTVRFTANVSTAYANIENFVYVGKGNWTFTGNADANFITGGAGNDMLSGGGGNDVLAGGAGIDTAVFTGSAAMVIDLVDGNASSLTETVGLTAIENITAGWGDDTIRGNALANLLDGGAGSDMMDGRGGNDIYIVDLSTDSVAETLSGTAGGIDLVKSSASFTLGANIENLELESGAGSIDGTGNTLANVITGNEGDNRLTGDAGNDSLKGNDGNDTLDGGAGTDTMTGGKGDDTYIVDSLADKVIELAGQGTSDTIEASITYSLAALPNIENLTLTGSADINGTGNAATNTITGNDGDNILDGGAGADHLFGGAGDDTYILDNPGDTVQELDGEGTDTVKEGFGNLDLNDAAYAFIENATLTGTKAFNLTGTSGKNVLTGNAAANTLTGGDGDDRLDGGSGKDILDGGTGDDLYVVDSTNDTIQDSSGNDTVQSAKISLNLAQYGGAIENATLTGTAALNLTGDDSANLLIGNDGANTLDGHGGQDILRGGKGGDTYIVDNANEIVDETGTDKGVDLVKSSVSFDLSVDTVGSTHSTIENLTLTGADNISGTGNGLNNVITGNSDGNVLDGGDGNDTLSGGDGNDTLDGGSGTDVMTGGTGDDTYVVDSLKDKIVERAGQGSDTVEASISYSIASLANIESLVLTGSGNINGTGNAAANDLFGNSGDNRLDGGAGNDMLDGNDGDDTLIGGAGDDWLTGGQGDDVMTGGAGADKFLFNSVLDAGTGSDRITDFTRGVDKIYLAGILWAFGNPTNPFADGYVTLVTSGKDTIIEVDADGSAGAGAPVNLVTVQNVHLTTADILTTIDSGSSGGDDIISGGGDDIFTSGVDITAIFGSSPQTTFDPTQDPATITIGGALTVLTDSHFPIGPGDTTPTVFSKDPIFQIDLAGSAGPDTTLTLPSLQNAPPISANPAI